MKREKGTIVLTCQQEKFAVLHPKTHFFFVRLWYMERREVQPAGTASADRIVLKQADLEEAVAVTLRKNTMQIYYALFHPTEKGGYTVTFPDAPAAVTEGDTVEEAVDMAIDALSIILGWGRKGRKYNDPSLHEVVRAQAEPGVLVLPIVPDWRIMEENRPKRRVNVMLPGAQLDAIAGIVADAPGLDRSKFIARAFGHYLVSNCKSS